MNRRILSFATVILALFTLAPSLRATDWSEVIKRVEQSVLWVNVDGEGGCTAFIINQEKHYLMTAAHCYADKGVLWADSVPTTVIALDLKKDMMVLEAKNLDPNRPALKLADKNPVRGEEVMSVGYGFALERPFFRQAHVQDDQLNIPSGGVGGPFISTDSPFVGGQSGGPVVNIKGEVVAIVQRGDGGSTGLGTGAELIKARLGRFFQTAKK